MNAATPKTHISGHQLYRESYLFDGTEAQMTKAKGFIPLNGKNWLGFTHVFGTSDFLSSVLKKRGSAR